MGFQKIIAGIFTLLLLSACSDPNIPIIERETAAIRNQISDLKVRLNDKSLTNAVVLKTYIDKTKITNPEYLSVLDALAVQHTPRNSGVKALEERLANIHAVLAKNNMTSDDAISELANLKLASQPNIFNDSLVDEINTVAALSNGALQPLNLPEGTTNKPGENLIGNPTYGRWRHNPGGSFWEWYGMYSMFGHVFGMPTYDRWYYNRPWSYGYDVYNNRYGSSRWKFNETNTMNRNYARVRSYGRSTNRKASSYASRNNNHAKIRAIGNGGTLNATRRKTASFGPSATRKSSPYASSSRSGTRSRSSRGGK